MKHFPNMFKKNRDNQAYCQVSVGRDVRKGPGRGCPKTIFQFLWVSGGPGRGNNYIFVELTGMTKVETRTSKNA